MVVSSDLQLSEELAAGPARLRIDVYGPGAVDHVLDDMTFLQYRLADVRIEPAVTLAEPDIVWRQDAEKAIEYDGRHMTFSGPWPAGPTSAPGSRLPGRWPSSSPSSPCSS